MSLKHILMQSSIISILILTEHILTYQLMKESYASFSN